VIAALYPYIYVNSDGTARELHPNERTWLETPFKLGDGAMPNIKECYEERNGWGEIRGYLERAKLPDGIAVQPAPAEDPSRPMSWDEFAAWLRAKGAQVIENKDGSLSVKWRGKGR
jgi:hypothetical protein